MSEIKYLSTTGRYEDGYAIKIFDRKTGEILAFLKFKDAEEHRKKMKLAEKIFKDLYNYPQYPARAVVHHTCEEFRKIEASLEACRKRKEERKREFESSFVDDSLETDAYKRFKKMIEEGEVKPINNIVTSNLEEISKILAKRVMNSKAKFREALNDSDSLIFWLFYR